MNIRNFMVSTSLDIKSSSLLSMLHKFVLIKEVVRILSICRVTQIKNNVKLPISFLPSIAISINVCRILRKYYICQG